MYNTSQLFPYRAMAVSQHALIGPEGPTSPSQGSGRKLPDIGHWSTSALTSVACIGPELNSRNK